jgi:hypothetical protein
MTREGTTEYTESTRKKKEPQRPQRYTEEGGKYEISGERTGSEITASCGDFAAQ